MLEVRPPTVVALPHWHHPLFKTRGKVKSGTECSWKPQESAALQKSFCITSECTYDIYDTIVLWLNSYAHAVNWG